MLNSDTTCRQFTSYLEPLQRVQHSGKAQRTKPVPDKQFDTRSINDKFLRAHICEGMGPFNFVSWNSKLVRAVSNPSSVGIVPFKPLLMASHRFVSFVERPNSDGIVPTRLFVNRLKWSAENSSSEKEKPNIGASANRRHLPKVVEFPNQVGIVPVSPALLATNFSTQDKNG